MTDQPNETETPHGETITHLGGYQLPYWDEDNGWPGTPFPGRWVPASKAVTGAVNAAAAFLDNGTVGTLRVWVGKTDTETGETWRVWGLTDRPVSATLYRDKDDQVGIHAVFIPAKPAPVREPLASELGLPAGLRWTAVEDMDGDWSVIGAAGDGKDVARIRVDYAVDEAGGDSEDARAHVLADRLNGGAW